MVYIVEKMDYWVATYKNPIHTVHSGFFRCTNFQPHIPSCKRLHVIWAPVMSLENASGAASSLNTLNSARPFHWHWRNWNRVLSMQNYTMKAISSSHVFPCAFVPRQPLDDMRIARLADGIHKIPFGLAEWEGAEVSGRWKSEFSVNFHVILFERISWNWVHLQGTQPIWGSFASIQFSRVTPKCL